MRSLTLAFSVLAPVVFVAGQTGALDPSTNENCTITQNWPDPMYPELGNTCADIAQYWFLDVQDFIDWNPIVGENCENLVEGSVYCVWVSDSSTAEEEGEESSEEENVSQGDWFDSDEDAGVSSSNLLDSNVPEDFVLEEDALDGENGSPISGDDCIRIGPGQQDCSTMASLWSISEEDFIAMNPSVGSPCSDIVYGQDYCVQARTHPDLDQSTTPDCATHIPYPDPSDLVREAAGHTCKSFTDFWYIRLEDFLEWNPVVGKECENFEEGKRYCIWVNGARSYYDHVLGNETMSATEGAAATATAKSESAETTSSESSASATASPSASSPADEGTAGLRTGGGIGALAWLAGLACLGGMIML